MLQWELFNNFRFLFAQHLGSHAQHLVCVFPTNIPRLCGPQPSPRPHQHQMLQEPTPSSAATGGRLNSFTRFSGEGVGREEEGAEGGLLGADLRIRSDVIAGEKLNSPVLWERRLIYLVTAHKGRPLWPRLNACEWDGAYAACHRRCPHLFSRADARRKGAGRPGEEALPKPRLPGSGSGGDTPQGGQSGRCAPG